MRRALGVCVFALCGLCCALPARGASDAGRTLRLELALVAGDARLLADPATPPAARQRLSERIRSSLGTLAIEAREAAQARRAPDPQLADALAGLARLFATGSPGEFARDAARLAAAQPLDLSYFEPLALTARRSERGRAIYLRYCVGCHVSPGADAAPNLFSLARTAPRAEFLARLLGGIHGDRTTSLENPFTDEDIASLAVYFLEAKDRPPPPVPSGAGAAGVPH